MRFAPGQRLGGRRLGGGLAVATGRWTIEHHADHWRWVGGPVPPGAAAVTLGPVVSLRRWAVGDKRLVRHELVHVAQWRHHGIVGFLRRYLGAYLRWRLRGHAHWASYRRIPLEIEASWTSRRRTEGSAAN